LIKEVTVEDLTKIEGIKKRKAKKIVKEIDQKIQDSVKVKEIEMGDSAEGEIKEEQIVEESKESKEKTGKSAPVSLSTKTSEWTPVEDKEEEKPEDEILGMEPIDLEPDIEKEKKIETFQDFKSIDDETAVLLYDGGYTTVDALTIATIKDLKKIKGIKKKKAKEIKKEMEDQSEWDSIPEEEFVEPEEGLLIDDSLNEQEEMEKLEKIQVYEDFSSIDDETAILLYDNDYTSEDSLKELTVKDCKTLGIKKRKAKAIIKEIEEKLILPITEEIEDDIPEDISDEEEFEEDESEGVDEKIDDYEEPLVEEEEFLEEEFEEDIPELEVEEVENPFSEINSVDEKISELLLENDVNSIEALNNMAIKELVKIKGIRRKIAKQIKKEVSEYMENAEFDSEEPMSIEENPFISEEDFDEGDEWESVLEVEKEEGPVYMHGDYTLYEKEVVTKAGNMRTIRFFSKGEPEDAKTIDIPKGYKVGKNKKTGVPYLKKKKKKKKK
jgi:ERCC4-type nuclease